MEPKRRPKTPNGKSTRPTNTVASSIQVVQHVYADKATLQLGTNYAGLQVVPALLATTFNFSCERNNSNIPSATPNVYDTTSKLHAFMSLQQAPSLCNSHALFSYFLNKRQIEDPRN